MLLYYYKPGVCYHAYHCFDKYGFLLLKSEISKIGKNKER